MVYVTAGGYLLYCLLSCHFSLVTYRQPQTPKNIGKTTYTILLSYARVNYA